MLLFIYLIGVLIAYLILLASVTLDGETLSNKDALKLGCISLLSWIIIIFYIVLVILMYYDKRKM